MVRRLQSAEDMILHPIDFSLSCGQWLLNKVFSPPPPGPHTHLNRPKVAIIGAGITGVSAAAHLIGHGHDVTIFEAGSRENLGGIWTRVNDSSGLQIHSAIYRFHPSVEWKSGYPNREQIVHQVEQLWERYHLNKKTKFDTKVTNIYQSKDGRWIINETSNGVFEGIIAAVGTCGEPKIPQFSGMDKFAGKVCHSSQLRGMSAEGKRIAIIGGGASAVEALEFASAMNADKTYILSRGEKWIIPRNFLVNVLLSWNVLGQETIFSRIPEFLLRKLFYRDLEAISPPGRKGIFTDTPMVNSDVMKQLRSGKAEWVRCDIEEFAENGIMVSKRQQGVPAGGPGKREFIEADMVIMATGYKRPSLEFLPEDCFEEPYAPPNWYLQSFPASHPSISAINCTYVNAIGTVGNWHIGIYSRILLMFLIDPLTRPSPKWMHRWIDMTRVLKSAGPTPAFDFFTYLELIWWFVFCIAINPFRWKWALFVFLGLGYALPEGTAHLEERALKHAEHEQKEVGRDVGSSF